MKKVSVRCLVVCLLALAALPGLSWGQANINEGLETAFLYIDTVHGNDTTGTGTITNPYKTINKGVTVAVANNQAGIGTQVNIQPGTYRESVNMAASGSDTSLPITFQAVTNGTVIIDGATVLTGWTVYSGNANIYQTNWTYNFGTCAQVNGCPTAQSIVLQQEMLAVNGAVMTQVLSIAELQPGSFYVDQAHALIYLYPPSGTNVNTATIETATQPALWTLAGKSNIVLRGLTFQYANSCRANGAVNIGGAGTNVLLDTLTVQWNNGQGIAISNPFTNYTVQNTVSNHNGDSGYQEYQTLNGLWTNDIADFNNWRGAQGGYYACNVGGSHPFQTHSDTINGMTFAYNQTYGIHWDTDNMNDTATDLTSTNNLIGAVFSEKNEGPLTINSSNLCNGSPLLGAGGVAIRNSTNVSLTNSTVINNPPDQIVVFGTPGGILITNWQTNQQINLITNALTLTGNVIEGEGSTQGEFQDATLNGSDWSTFIKNFDSNSNTWWNASNSTTPFEVPVPAVDTFLNFAGWQTTTGQDASSTFSAPSGNPGAICGTILPDAPDYWLNIDNILLTMNPVGQAVFNLTATPLSFSGTLSLLLDGTSGIAGLTSGFSPTTIPLSGGNAGTSVLTISDTTATPAGTYPVTIVANSGNTTHMVTAQVTVPAPGFRLNTILLAFGNQTQNTTSAAQSVTLTNNAKTSTKITSVVSNLPVFAIKSNTCGTSLGAGKSCTVTVTFTPNSAGNFVGTLTFTDADPTSPQIVTLTGTGTAIPTATVVPGTLAFGSVTVGSTSSALSSTLTDTSTSGALNITSITITGANAADFKLGSATTCPTSGTVQPLGTCLLSVTFTPGATGSRSATLTVNDNTSSKKQTISLNGSGAAAATATLLPATLTFASQAVGTTSAGQSSTLTDTSSTVALNITSIALTGANPGDFAISSASTCPSSGTVKAKATCLVTITFTPTATGTRSATLNVNDNATGSPQTVSLTGTGTAGSTATATLLPGSLTFASQAVGTTSAGQSSTLTDTSTTVALNISGITLTGANAGDFKLASSSTCPTSGSINPLATCLVTITFSPTASGARSATLNVFDNTTAGSQTVSLTGTGTGSSPTATLLPASLNFGSINVGTLSAALSSTLTDTSATTALAITNASITGTNASDFALAAGTTCPTSGNLNPLATCIYSITFNPGATGARSATLTVTDNATGGSQTVALSGTGTSGGGTTTATLVPASMSFGTVSIGTTSPSKTSVLTNTGATVSLSISSITLTGTAASDYSFAQSTCPNPGSVAPLGACNVVVTFTPSASGSRPATLTVNDNTFATHQTITLNGSGK